MAREIPFKRLPLEIAQGQFVDYKEVLPQVLNAAPPNGITPDELLRRVGALKPIKAAIAAGAGAVVLEDEHWRCLTEALASHRFGLADPALAELITDVREAKEIDIQAATKNTKPR